jgi:hypothetical protein
MQSATNLNLDQGSKRHLHWQTCSPGAFSDGFVNGKAGPKPQQHRHEQQNKGQKQQPYQETQNAVQHL